MSGLSLSAMARRAYSSILRLKSLERRAADVILLCLFMGRRTFFVLLSQPFSVSSKAICSTAICRALLECTVLLFKHSDDLVFAY